MHERRPVAVDVRRVDPDPSIAAAVGRHHSLATAVTDLIDNSIDAGARNVLVRVLQRDDRAIALLVVDDGSGMDSDLIDDAMAYAHRREYGTADLGHFGIGLKAASLSQADTLYVWSKRWGAPAVGRGLERESLDDGPLVQTFSTDDAVARLAEVDPGFPFETGTMVEWRDVRGFLQSPDLDEQRAWLESAIEELRTHLGLVLHRIVARGDVAIRLDVLDEDYPEFGGVPRSIEALDPFGYQHSALPGYPQELTLALSDGIAAATLHLWPAGQGDANWFLGRRGPLETQGLYIYRNDRLLQTGGWNGLTSASRDLMHARVALDLVPLIASHATINPEKTGVVLDAALISAWNNGQLSSGGRFADYLEAARSGAQQARKRNPRPVQVAQPGRGYGVAVAEALEENAEFFPGVDPVDIRWRRLMDDEVLRVDRDERTLWLNSRYRAALGGTAGLRNDDAQVTKAILHLLLGDHLTGPNAGAREKKVERAWNAVLLAAAQDEDGRAARAPGRHAAPALSNEEDE